MRFYWARFHAAMRRAHAWCVLFGRRFRHTFTSRLVLAPLLCIITLWLYSRYITELNFFLIIDQDRTIVHETYTRDPGEALREAGIYVGTYDSVSLPEWLTAGGAGEIEIVRATGVSVTLDGVTVPVTCLGGTVADALSKAGYVEKPNDILSHALNAPIEEGMRITVSRIEIYDEYEYETIPYDTIEHENSYLNFGSIVVTAEGSEGERSFQYRVTKRDGEVISRQLVLEQVTKEPTTRIVEHGTGGTIKLADGTRISYKKRMDVICTAYNTERQVNKINASGKIARKGTIAVDPRVIPLGTKVYVTSRNGTWVYGVAICEDTGGAIKGNIIDLFFDTWDECVIFGRKPGYLYIL